MNQTSLLRSGRSGAWWWPLTAALKTGENVLEARFPVNVYLRGGQLQPATSGAIALDLRAGDLSRFEIRTGPILGAAGTDFFTVGCRTRMPATVTLHCAGRTWTSEPGVLHVLRAEGLNAGLDYDYKLVAELAGGGAPASSRLWKVKTLPAAGPLTFVALGDALQPEDLGPPLRPGAEVPARIRAAHRRHCRQRQRR